MLAALFLVAHADLPPEPERQAQATVKIMSAERIDERSYGKRDERDRREIVVRERDGRLTRVRLTEFQ